MLHAEAVPTTEPADSSDLLDVNTDHSPQRQDAKAVLRTPMLLALTALHRLGTRIGTHDPNTP